jgi:hypothetical protein
MKGVLRIKRRDGSSKEDIYRLTKQKMQVGRSSEMDLKLDDPTISKCHLEISVEDDAVFVENKSRNGTLLNGKTLAGVVSLTSGDVLQLGATSLCYERDSHADGLQEADSIPRIDRDHDPDGTRVVAMPSPDPSGSETPERGTSAYGESGTRVGSGGIDFPPPPGPRVTKRPLWPLVLLLCLTIPASGYGLWWLSRKPPVNVGSVTLEDLSFGFRLAYPADWSVINKPDSIEIGKGKPGEADYVSILVEVDRDPIVEFIGMTHGFSLFQRAVSKAMQPEFEVVNATRLYMQQQTADFARFEAGQFTGTLFYVPNGSTCFRVLAKCSQKAAAQYQPAIADVLQSFTLTSTHQEYIDFPLPTEDQKNLALVNPDQLSRKIADHRKSGEQLFENRNVRPENLFRSVQAFGTALQFATAGPNIHPDFREVATQLRDATRQLDALVRNQLIDLRRATRQGDREATIRAARKIMQLNPNPKRLEFREAQLELKNATRASS